MLIYPQKYMKGEGSSRCLRYMKAVNGMKNNCKGFTIVNVITAFALLLIGIAAVFSCVIVTGNIMRRAADMRESEKEIIQAYYYGELTDTESSDIPVTVTVRGQTLHLTLCQASGKAEGSDNRVCYFIPGGSDS